MADQNDLALIRSFKRQYHKVKQAAPKVIRGGDFTLRGSATPGGIEIQLTNPGETDTAHFISLMGRFLRREQDLFYPTVWESLLRAWSGAVQHGHADQINGMIEALQTGSILPLSITLNERSLTPRQIYDAIAEGEYFSERPEYQPLLRDLRAVPVMLRMAWFQFYSFHLRGLELISSLFDVIQLIEASEEYQSLLRESAVGNPRCIFCLTTAGSFDSEEHVFPESLGNDELVLPRGHVCTTCNTDVLSDLDNALVNFPPVAMFRVQFVPHAKSGKFPEAKLGHLTMTRTSPRRRKVVTQGKTPFFTEEEELGDGWVRFRFNHKWNWSRRLTPELVSRGLYKIALGMLALDQGADFACGDRYAAAREFVLGRRGTVPNSLLIGTLVQPKPRGGATVYPLSAGTFVRIDIFGIPFIVNLESTPAVTMNETLAAAGFGIFPRRD